MSTPHLPDEGSFTPRQALFLFLVFAWAYFLSALVRAVTATLAPTLTADLGLSPGDLGLLAGAYFFGFAVMQLPLGRWLDRFGPRRVLVAFLAVAVAGCAAFALARGFAGLTLARALIGAGVSACLMAPLTGFRRWFSPTLQLRANSWMLMTGSLGMLASTLPVQWLLPLTGWRGLFWLLGLCLVLSILALWWIVPRDEPVAVPQAGDDTPPQEGYAAIWRNPDFRRYAGLGFVNYGGMIALQTLWIGPWLVNVAGWSPTESAGGLFIVNAAMLVTFLSWGLVLPRLQAKGWGAARLITVGAPWSLAVLTLNLVLGAQATAWAWALYCVSCTFMALAQPLVGQAFPTHLAGRALSAYNLVIFAGVFAMQWGIGLAVDLGQALGLDTLQAYRLALGLYGLLGAWACWGHWRSARAAARPPVRVSAG
jgi:predicted MFS family arabinose efflux permease